MTPAELIEDVLGDIARPDLQEKAELKFVEAVRSAHKIGRFRQDLTTHYAVDNTPHQERVILNLRDVIPRFRELIDIQLFETYNIGSDNLIYPDKMINVGRKFVDIQNRLNSRDYFGYAHPYTFAVSGASLTLNGVPQNATALAFIALTYPEVTRDPLTQEITTDSWILEDHPQLIKAYLYFEIATMIQDRARISTALTKISLYREEFVSTHNQDFV